MNPIYEINMNNAQVVVDTGRVKQNSPVVEVFSARSGHEAQCGCQGFGQICGNAEGAVF